MNNLELLQSRIKTSNLWVHPKNGTQRLYIEGFCRKTAKMKARAYFEIVNDRITPHVSVRCEKQGEAWENDYKKPIIERIYKKFHELIYNCELERKKTPLDIRLKDDVPPVYDNSLPHQVKALWFCCSMKVSALYGDVGTSKTKIVIDLAVSRYLYGQINKVLVFCPVSTINNFREEINKWSDVSALPWHIVGLESMSMSDRTYIKTLNMADKDTMIIIDESHNVKTPFAKRSKRIKQCCELCSYKVILTGTPAESVKDLYMQYAMLSNLIIGEKNWLDFENKYLIVDDRGDVIGYKNIDYLMGLIEPYTYQIIKEECMVLPKKHFKEVACNLTPKQETMYYNTKQELLDKLEQFDDCPAPATLIFKYFTKLQQIASGFLKEKNTYKLIGTNKFEELYKTEYYLGQTIFFCKYVQEVYMLTEFLGADNCAVFTGENRKTRDSEKRLFTTGKKKYFVATDSSGGTGLNGLQHCNRLIFFSRSFKYIARTQCIGRIDRQGQDKEMYIYDMLPGCGIEDRIMFNIARKGNLATEIKMLLKDKTKLKEYVQNL